MTDILRNPFKTGPKLVCKPSAKYHPPMESECKNVPWFEFQGGLKANHHCTLGELLMDYTFCVKFHVYAK